MKYIRSDKIYHHPKRLLAYQNRELVRPITVEIHLTNKCNLDCYYCSFKDKDKRAELSLSNAMAVVTKIKNIGAKAITFSGGGEPTAHPNYRDIIRHAKDIGLDVGLITNGVKLDPAVLNYLKWIRFSVDAADSSIYKRIKGINAFNKVIGNIKKAVDFKNKGNLKTTIGFQAVVTKNNKDSLGKIAILAESLGLDYFQYRPVEEGNNIDKPELDGDFNIEILDSQYKWSELKNTTGYTECPGADFIGAVGADFNFYICCHHVGDKTASYGNILTDDILANRKRVQESFDYTKCPIACRGSVINSRLSFYNKIEHGNFL